MEEQAGDERLAMLQPAIDFVCEVKTRVEEPQYRLFLDVLRRFANDWTLLYTEVSSIFHDHPDLLRTFVGFLPVSKPPPLSQTVSTKHQDAVKALKLQANAFLTKVNPRLRHSDFVVFLEEIHECVINEFDRNKSKAVVEKNLGQFSDLMKEFEDFWNKSAELKASSSTKKSKHEQSSSATATANEPCLCETQDCTCPPTEPSP